MHDAQVTVEILHYFTVEGQLASLATMQKEFEAANPDIKLKLHLCAVRGAGQSNPANGSGAQATGHFRH